MFGLAAAFDGPPEAQMEALDALHGVYAARVVSHVGKLLLGRIRSQDRGRQFVRGRPPRPCEHC
jgi:hypothetical protein